MKQESHPLSRIIGYQFAESKLLDMALRHRSAKGSNNERLEFLGDSILNCVIAAELYKRQPRAKEGDLSRMRAALVKGATLAKVAKGFGLGQYLELGIGELKSGGASRSSILADAVEAIIGAIYLDSDFDTCYERITHWFEDKLQAIDGVLELKDPKTKLQEHLQAKKFALPRYQVIKIEGDAHDQTFTVSCEVDALGLHAEGMGGSRRKAEQAAAQLLLSKIEQAGAA